MRVIGLQKQKLLAAQEKQRKREAKRRCEAAATRRHRVRSLNLTLTLSILSIGLDFKYQSPERLRLVVSIGLKWIVGQRLRERREMARAEELKHQEQTELRAISQVPYSMPTGPALTSSLTIPLVRALHCGSVPTTSRNKS